MDLRTSPITTQPPTTSSAAQLSFQLHLQTTEALWRACSRLIAAGELFVPTAQPPPVGSEISLQLLAAEICPPAISGRVLSIDQQGPPGFQAQVTPSDAFKEFFAREVKKRRIARRQGGKRWHNRFNVDLEVRFEDLPENGIGRATNLSRGGIFVATTKPAAAGSNVRITLGLPSGERVSGVARVVHVVTPSLFDKAAAAGVGLSFLKSDHQLLNRIEALVAEYEQASPRVLVVDDDDDFRAALSDALRASGMTVDEAGTGEEALRKLVDTLFELDVVLLDIRMPGLDGRGFLDRVRRLGGELDLRIIVLSAAPRSELQAFKGPGAANDALSKADELSEIVNRIKLALAKETATTGQGHPA